MKHLTPFFISIRNNVAAFVLFLVLWGVSSVFFPPYIVPSPLQVLLEFGTYWHTEFLQHLGMTLYRVLMGFLLSFGLGTALGILASGLHKRPHLNTLMVLFQVLPGAVLGVIFLLMFGIGSCVPIALVTFLTLPTIAINTSNGLSKKNVLLEHYLHSIGGTTKHLVKNIYLPLLIPTLQSNLTLGFGLSLKVVILGEFIGSQDGIGYLLNVSKVYFKMDEVFFYLFVILAMMVCFQIGQNIVFTSFLGKYFYPE
ncbi:MAG: ABC transporter permease subunit [Candidatus Vecturithrix sp.]|jgi:ABC-type nitrate/sulfonate/bicarbonate transport system permease component|nr:ABC transporter permease subunit [Candidatus Vecturithrix sp.]